MSIQSSDVRNSGGDVVSWIRANRLAAILIGVITVTLIYFFGFLKIFGDQAGLRSTLVWAWHSWNPTTNYEHGVLIVPIAIFLVWYERHRIKSAPVSASNWGWLFIVTGIALFVIGARALQARFSLTALPILLFGIVLYAVGPRIARILLFPIGFLFFMVPLNFLTQGTTGLQTFDTRLASKICNFLGVGVYALGNTINATNDTFHFSVDDGCSGVRSLMAIAMLAALYAYFTQDRLWKQLTIFAGSILFALVGNAGRLVSIVLMARLFGQDLAGGPYHAISGYLSFPFALVAMVLFGKLLNIGSKRRDARVTRSEVAKETVSYDY